MTASPVIFSAPMVRALLAGRKTQTRRLAWRTAPWHPGIACKHGYDACPTCEAPKPTIWQKVRPSNRLWVKETRWVNGGYVATQPENFEHEAKRPSIYMPRCMSRLTLTVTNVRIQRVQEIGLRDVTAEGCEVRQFWLFGADIERRNEIGRAVYGNLWRTLHKKPGNRWDDNPEIVALTFKVERH